MALDELKDALQTGASSGGFTAPMKQALEYLFGSGLNAALQAGSGITITYDPEAGTFTFTASGSAQTFSATAGEDLVAGEFVAINASGEAVLADASTNDLLAVGFVLANVASTATAQIHPGGLNTALTGMTTGEQYYLSDTVPGGVTDTPPTGEAPTVVQQLGVAGSSTTMLVNIQQAIELP